MDCSHIGWSATSSNDPDFETKAADVIGLYLNPPAHAAVFCVDEKTAIQALDRKDRMLSLAPGQAESHGFEYKRNGTLSLFAALNTATGEVLGMTDPRHTSEQFVAFLSDVVGTQPQGREIHVICDHVSSHKTGLVNAFLLAHKNVQIHYMPTYSSWLNQVENWFSRIQRDVISRGIFTSVKDLDKKIMRCIRQYNTRPKPLKWKYDNPQRRHHQILLSGLAHEGSVAVRQFKNTGSDWLLPLSSGGWVTAAAETCHSSSIQASGCHTSELARDWHSG